ncbi:MAG: His/Gly/Thr/Pro-type tRNA ligase C-terminal domain-containing protein, partial [Oceanospirillum sp.]|nr:His/Gly/Thr/Pro-type tRNA ligase C-terminal domain-containing protein [Oceanospirillum sp.]
LMLQTLDAIPEHVSNQPQIFIAAVGEGMATHGLLLGEMLREKTGYRTQMHCGGGSFKSQIKKADKSGAAIALILGENEVANGEVAVKFLREARDQETVSLSGLIEFLQDSGL